MGEGVHQIVETRQGAVNGRPDAEDTLAWLAIPYAKPPVGELRWKAPRDAEPWQGVRDETAFSKLACQAIRAEDRSNTSEDCLYLNVWRPRTQEQRLPVYFWIHGGGNTVALPTPEATPGASIAARSNVVFVSINYRLGEFGWFAHPSLRTGRPGDEYDDSGNYGTLDIVKALTWVRDNIEAFGGDPGNVFVSGESAGAFNTLCLLISPAAKGLFHKAMAQSGRQNTYSMEAAERHAGAVLRQLLINDGTAADEREAESRVESMGPEETAAYLRSKDFHDFLTCRRASGFIAAFTDGAVLHRDGFRSLKEGTYPNKVPAIVGMNKDEAKFALFLAQAYRRLDEPTYEAVAAHLSDLKKATGCDDVLRSLRSHADQPPVYGYQMLWGHGSGEKKSPLPPPADFRLGAFHGVDIPFFFNAESSLRAMGEMSFTEENKPGRQALTDAMMSYIAAFVRSGDPNPPAGGLPRWEPWSNDDGGPKCILFDVDGDDFDIKMTAEELTEAGVRSGLQQVAPPVREQIERYSGPVPRA